jgi:HK97 family phage major capsid protein
MSTEQLDQKLDKMATGITGVVEKQATFETSLKSVQDENAKLNSALELKNKEIEDLKAKTEEIEATTTKMKKAVRFSNSDSTSATEEILDLTKGFDVANKYMNCFSNISGSSKEFNDVVSKNYNENKNVIQKHLSKKFNYNFDATTLKSLTTIDTSSSVDGGIYLPPIEFLPAIEQQYRQTPILDEVSTYVIKGREAKIPYISRRGNWTALKEGESLNSDSDKFKTPSISFKTVSASKYATMIDMTDEDNIVMQQGNGGALMNMIDKNRVDILLELYAELITMGNPNEPMTQQGFLTPFDKQQVYPINAPKDHQVNKVGLIQTANVNTIIYDDLVNLTTRTLLSKYKPTAKLMMNSNTLAYLSTLKDSIGQYHFRPQGTLNGVVVPATINGVQVVINDFMPDVATGVVPIIYGDLKQAIAQIKCFADTMYQLAKVPGDHAHIRFLYNTYHGSTILDYQSFRYLEIA